MKRLINHSLLVALLALSYGAAFAQAPASQDSNTAAASDKSAGKTEKMESPKTSKMGTGTTKMDADGDGTVTKQEWDAYHAAMWDKLNKGGKVSTADAEAMMKGVTN